MTDIEKKLALTHFIREENEYNRNHMRFREDILYGKETSGLDYGISSFRVSFFIRLFLAALLFTAVIYLDKNGIQLHGEDTAELLFRQLQQNTLNTQTVWEDAEEKLSADIPALQLLRKNWQMRSKD